MLANEGHMSHACMIHFSCASYVQAWYACMPVWYNKVLYHTGMRPLQKDARRKQRLHFFFLFFPEERTHEVHEEPASWVS